MQSSSLPSFALVPRCPGCCGSRRRKEGGGEATRRSRRSATHTPSQQLREREADFPFPGQLLVRGGEGRRTRRRERIAIKLLAEATSAGSSPASPSCWFRRSEKERKNTGKAPGAIATKAPNERGGKTDGGGPIRQPTGDLLVLVGLRPGRHGSPRGATSLFWGFPTPPPPMQFGCCLSALLLLRRRRLLFSRCLGLLLAAAAAPTF